LKIVWFKFFFFVISIRHIKNDIPTFVVDAPHGGGKIPVMPNYIVSQSADKVVLRNFEGVITSYPEPKGYQPHDEENCSYCQAAKGKSIGVAALMRDERNNLEPEALPRNLRIKATKIKSLADIRAEQQEKRKGQETVGAVEKERGETEETE
jgi:lysine 2,3-aminomutase